jgi:hypothetical protein
VWARVDRFSVSAILLASQVAGSIDSAKEILGNGGSSSYLESAWSDGFEINMYCFKSSTLL